MRPAVSVMVPGGSPTAVWHLLPGQLLQFGECHCGRCQIDLLVPVSRAEPVAGRVRAYHDHWRLDNLGVPALTVTDLEQPCHRLLVVSGRTGMVVPFELGRVFAGDQPVATVFGPEPARGSLQAPCPATPSATHRNDLDPDTTYFAVLVALCEPRLRPAVENSEYPAAATLPTSAEIAQALCRQGRSVTTAAVDRHIDYLVSKLDLRPRDPQQRRKRGWRKEALASAALARGLVGPRHPDPADRAALVRN